MVCLYDACMIQQENVLEKLIFELRFEWFKEGSIQPSKNVGRAFQAEKFVLFWGEKLTQLIELHKKTNILGVFWT